MGKGAVSSSPKQEGKHKTGLVPAIRKIKIAQRLDPDLIGVSKPSPGGAGDLVWNVVLGFMKATQSVQQVTFWPEAMRFYESDNPCVYLRNFVFHGVTYDFVYFAWQITDETSLDVQFEMFEHMTDEMMNSREYPESSLCGRVEFTLNPSEIKFYQSTEEMFGDVE